VNSKQQYIVMQPFKVNTHDGIKTMDAGTSLSLADDKALPLLLKGLAEPADPAQKEFNRKLLAGELLVNITTATGRLISIAGHIKAVDLAAPGKAVFLPEEVMRLKNAPPEMIELLITTKEMFPGGLVEEVIHSPEAVPKHKEQAPC